MVKLKGQGPKSQGTWNLALTPFLISWVTWASLPGARREENCKVLQEWSLCFIVLCVSLPAFNAGQARCVCVRGLLIDYLGVTSDCNLQ